MEMESLRHPFPAIYAPDSRILILGSFPSVKSREQMFFYGHPQNRFWRVIAALLGADVPQTVAEKRAFLLANHIALWDVIASCDIAGFVFNVNKRPDAPAVPEIYLPAHRAGGYCPPLHEPRERRALA